MSVSAFLRALAFVACAGAAGVLGSCGPVERPEPERMAVDSAALPGKATLRLLLEDVHTGKTVRSWAELWRLGVPEDEEWTAGDEMVESTIVEEEGVLLTGLVPGRYRVECREQRQGVADPPEFEVLEGVNRVVRTIVRPIEFPARLMVFDEDGTVLARGTREDGGSYGYGSGSSVPPWARLRWRRGESPSYTSGGSTACGTGRFRRAAVEASDGWFDLGPWHEPRRGYRDELNTYLEFKGRNSVSVKLDGSLLPGNVLVALSISDSRILDAVLLSNGTAARDGGARVTWTRATAVVVAEGKEHGAWREIPVSVRVEAPGHEVLEFECRLDDLHVPRRMVAGTPETEK